MIQPDEPRAFVVGQITVAEKLELNARQEAMAREQAEIDHRLRVLTLLRNELAAYGRTITDRLNLPPKSEVRIEDSGEVFLVGALLAAVPDGATADTGTLPGASSIDGGANVTATGAATNRSMDGNKGTTQVSIALSTVASTSVQFNWYRRFLSAPIAAQTIDLTKTFTFSGAYSQSSTNSKLSPNVCWGIWTPSTGALSVGAGVMGPSGGSGSVLGATAETVFSYGRVGTGSWTSLDHDVLVFEMWGENAESMATSYTNTYFYDGTTEASATTCAAFFDMGQAITMYAAPSGRAYSQVVVVS